ncbi:hypothetical protein L1887_59053 [Cichorium endivia]|nr:hypothetical protein L1887_59053 [Cichorium endivia]
MVDGWMDGWQQAEADGGGEGEREEEEEEEEGIEKERAAEHPPDAKRTRPSATLRLPDRGEQPKTRAASHPIGANRGANRGNRAESRQIEIEIEIEIAHRRIGRIEIELWCRGGQRASAVRALHLGRAPENSSDSDSQPPRQAPRSNAPTVRSCMPVSEKRGLRCRSGAGRAEKSAARREKKTVIHRRCAGAVDGRSRASRRLALLPRRAPPD